jgi:hypothetical protein
MLLMVGTGLRTGYQAKARGRFDGKDQGWRSRPGSDLNRSKKVAGSQW